MIGAHWSDPDHTYVTCDCCAHWGIRLDPIEGFNMLTHQVEIVREAFTADEAYAHLLEVGWSRSEVLDGNVRRIRDLCSLCRFQVVG